jgi:hypothetical protein
MKIILLPASFSRFPGEGTRMRYLPDDEVCDTTGDDKNYQSWLQKKPYITAGLLQNSLTVYLKSTTSTPGYFFLSKANSASDIAALGFKELIV